MAFSNINPKSDYEFSKILNKFVTPSEPITTPERLFGREDELKKFFDFLINTKGCYINALSDCRQIVRNAQNIIFLYLQLNL